MSHQNGTATAEPDYQKILAERLAEPETAKSLVGLLDRIDTVETALSGLEEMMEKLPAVIASAQQESQLSGQMREVSMLVDKISQPEVMRALGGLLDKAETLETLVSGLEMLTEKAPELADSFQKESGQGSALGEVSRLVDAISRPEVMRNLTTIIDNMDTIATLASAAGEAERQLPELLASMHNESNLGRTIQQYLELGQRLADDSVINNLNNLVDKIENLDAVLNILDEIVRNNPELKEPNSTTVQNINELFELLTKSMKEEEASILETARGGIQILAEVNKILLSPKMEVVIRGISSAMKHEKENVPEVGPIGLLKMLSDRNTRKTLGLASLLTHEIGGQLDYLDCNRVADFDAKHADTKR